MKTRLVRIGNSQGIRIPKPLIEQCGLSGEIELQLQDDALIIKRIGKPRSGWAAAFAAMRRNGDDDQPNRDTWPKNDWDDTDWQW
jgi:antitoxin MazE